MRAVWIFALLTLREASRSRLLALAGGLTVLFVGLMAWGVHALNDVNAANSPVQRVAGMAAIDLLGFFVASFMVALLAVFVSGASPRSDAESGLLQAIAARPVRRFDLMAGKWLGSAAILAVYIALLSVAIAGVVWAFSGYTPPHLLLADALLLLEALTMLTYRLLFGTFLTNMPSGILPLMLYGLAWMGGLVEVVGQQLDVHALVNAGIITSLIIPTDILWRGASFFLEPSDIAVAVQASRGIPFIGNAPIATPMVIWAVVNVAGVFAAGAGILSRRDI